MKKANNTRLYAVHVQPMLLRTIEPLLHFLHFLVIVTLFDIFCLTNIFMNSKKKPFHVSHVTYDSLQVSHVTRYIALDLKSQKGLKKRAKKEKLFKIGPTKRKKT